MDFISAQAGIGKPQVANFIEKGLWMKNECEDSDFIISSGWHEDELRSAAAQKLSAKFLGFLQQNFVKMEPNRRSIVVGFC